MPLGYGEVVEYIAGEIAGECEGPEDVENSVRTYMESLEGSVTERVKQLSGWAPEPSLIRVTASPHAEDGDLPWEYQPDGFLNWYWEVFQECEDDAPKVTVAEAISNLEAQGYTIETEE